MPSPKRTILSLDTPPKRRILKADRYEKGQFFKMASQPLRSPQLSWEAKGLLTFLHSYPAHFQHTFANILKHSKAKEKAIRTLLKELEAHKLLIRQRIRRKTSEKIEWIWIVSETSIESDTFFNCQDSPDVHVQPVHIQDVPVQNVSVQSVHIQGVSVQQGDPYYNSSVYNKPSNTTEPGSSPPVCHTADTGYSSPPLNTTTNTTTSSSRIEKFSSEEVAIRQWASRHAYWKEIVQEDQRFRAALDSSSARSLRAQYQEEVTNQTDREQQLRDLIEASDRKRKEKAERVLTDCPYCDEHHFLELLDAQGRQSTAPCRHWKNTVERTRARGLRIISTKKGYRPPPEEQDVVICYEEAQKLR